MIVNGIALPPPVIHVKVKEKYQIATKSLLKGLTYFDTVQICNLIIRFIIIYIGYIHTNDNALIRTSYWVRGERKIRIINAQGDPSLLPSEGILFVVAMVNVIDRLIASEARLHMANASNSMRANLQGLRS